MDCVNLSRDFGDRYRIDFDPAYDPKNRPAGKLDPWMMVIPCRVGEIYPNGDAELAVEVEGYPKVKARLARLPCCRSLWDGDFGYGAFLFDMADFDEVAEIVKPYRKPRISAERKAELREQMTKLNRRRRQGQEVSAVS